MYPAYDLDVTAIERALALAERLGMNQSTLAKRLGVKPQHLTNWKTRGLPSDRVTDLSAVLSCTTDYLLGRSDTPSGYVMNVQPGQYSLTADTQAHLMSLDKRTVPPTRTRAEIMGGTAGDLYAFKLDDDALAPDFPRGTEFVFDVRKEPTPRSVVLVLDEHQQLHAREYRQGAAPGQWIAGANNRAFQSFDSASIKLLAVARYLTLP